jgi:hypothetical protein
MNGKQVILYLFIVVIVILLFSLLFKKESFKNLNNNNNNNKRNNLNNRQVYNGNEKWPIGTLSNPTERSYKDFYGLNEPYIKPKNNTPYIQIPDAITSLTPASIEDKDINNYLTESYLNGYKLATFKNGIMTFGDLNLTDQPTCNWVKIGYLSAEKTFLDEDKDIFTLYRTDTDKQNEYKFKAVLLNGAQILLPPEIKSVSNSEILPPMNGTVYSRLGSMKVSLDRSFSYNFTI